MSNGKVCVLRNLHYKHLMHNCLMYGMVCFCALVEWTPLTQPDKSWPVCVELIKL